MDENTIRKATELIKLGDKQGARKLLAQVVKRDPNNELAWLWLSACVSKREQKIQCLNKVLEINPNNQKAQTVLEKLSPSFEPSLGDLLNDTHKPVSPLSLDSGQPKSRKKSSLVPTLFFLILIACIVLFVIGNSLSREDESKAIRDAWISGIESCPTHSEYGQVVVKEVNSYSSREMLPPPIVRIPHGARVEILEEEYQEFYKVRYRGTIGYVQSIFVVDYDPATGVKPNTKYCLP